MSVELVKCQYCNYPGTFYIWNGKGMTKVTDPLVRITSKESEVSLFAHQHCHLKGTQQSGQPR